MLLAQMERNNSACRMICTEPWAVYSPKRFRCRSGLPDSYPVQGTRRKLLCVPPAQSHLTLKKQALYSSPAPTSGICVPIISTPKATKIKEAMMLPHQHMQYKPRTGPRLGFLPPGGGPPCKHHFAFSRSRTAVKVLRGNRLFHAQSEMDATNSKMLVSQVSEENMSGSPLRYCGSNYRCIAIAERMSFFFR